MPTRPGMPSYLIPSYVQHMGGFACEKSKFCCYHAAIRVGPVHGGFIVWSTDACAGRTRSLALEQSEYELMLTRKRRVWPKYWNVPLEIERRDLPEFLQKLPPEQEKVIKMNTRQENTQKVAIEEAMNEYRAKTQKPKSMMELLEEHAAKRDAALTAQASTEPPQEIDMAQEKTLDKRASEAYDPATMFGSPDEPQPEQPDGAEPSPTK